MARPRFSLSRETDEGLPDIEYRPYRGPGSQPALLSIMQSSEAADGKVGAPAPGDIAAMCAPKEGFLPSRDLDLAYVLGKNGEGSPLGFSKRSWYSGYRGCLLYCQYSCLSAEGRRMGLWPLMVRRNESRLRALHAARPASLAGGEAMLQAWAAEGERDWAEVLEGEGYKVVRSFHNMSRSTREVPARPMPPGFETRPVEEPHLRAIWQAQRALNLGVFECVGEDWGEESFGGWAEEARGRTGLWQVAWHGGEVVATVLAHYEAGHRGRAGKSRGFTEHIFVRPEFRGRGLAGALVAAALKALHDQGVEEAELGVDSQNESAAFELYKKLGYETESVDRWYRKPL